MNLEFFFISFLCFTVATAIRPLDPNRVQSLDIREDAQQNYRLPNSTKPVSYDVTLKTYLEKNDFHFDGFLTIIIQAVNETSEIKLHHRQLKIDTIALLKDGNDIYSNNSYNNVTEILTINAEENLVPDKTYELKFSYAGDLRSDCHGFYKSSYKDANGMERWLAATQFESTDARHAFPCYDEPAFKANFIIRIEHAKGYNAISNMNGTKRDLGNQRSQTDFQSTPLISSYLIAFIVSDFQYVESNVSATNPHHQRIFTSKNKLDQTGYALDEAVNILNAMENYLQVPFELPKMDNAGIPDFAAGAMENWGLVTYREEYLLYDANVHLPSRQIDISTIISHEFGHQWFGDLVSPKWWTYIWLNEGFATLFAFIGTDLVHPDWNIFQHFIANQLQLVLRADATNDTRSMNTYAETPTGIKRLFDPIAYQKSGSVIRMFLHALGEQTFKKGLKYYLEANSHNVADENNLFESLDKAAKEDNKLDANLTVKDLFGSWSNQKGFPLLKVTRNSDASVTIKQEKYNDESDQSTWWIPYNFASALNPVINETKPLGWLPKDTREKRIVSDNNIKWTNDDWLLFNIQQTGYYRVLYDEKNYNLINKELNTGNFEKIHPISRSQYLDDLDEFVNSGRIDPKILFNALSYLGKENSYAPWVTASRTILKLKTIFETSKSLSDFNEFIVKLVSPFYESKKLDAAENEGLFDKISRTIAVDLACSFGVEKCLNETFAKFEDFIENSNKPQPHNRGVILANGIRRADYSLIERYWTWFLATTSSDERKEAIKSFGNIQNVDSIGGVLNKTIEVNAAFSSTDRSLVVETIIGGSQIGLSATIQFLYRDLGNVNTTIGSVLTILQKISLNIVTSEVETQFISLLEHVKNAGLIVDSDIDAIKKVVAGKVSWQKNHLEQYENALKSAAQMLTTLPALLALLFCIVRWNSQ